MKVNLKQMGKEIETNKKERLWFINYWAEYVRTHADGEWSKQQNVLINSMMQNSKNYPLTKEQYLEIKGELKKK